MRLRLIAVGSRMPRWVEEGWQEYVKRLPAELSLELVEIPLNTRGKNADVARLIRQEGEAMLARVQPGERVVTLEVEGRPWSTEQLARELDRWRLDARTVNLMVGGPEGLAPEVCARSEQRWSLSPLTLPHRWCGSWSASRSTGPGPYCPGTPTTNSPQSRCRSRST